jgi:hypothetical protein
MADINDKQKGLPNRPFSASEQRDKLIRQEIEKERAATDAKTAKLRALRLAKEAEDRARDAANPPPPKPAGKRRKGAG